jgi:hypothetical protein
VTSDAWWTASYPRFLQQSKEPLYREVDGGDAIWEEVEARAQREGIDSDLAWEIVYEERGEVWDRLTALMDEGHASQALSEIRRLLAEGFDLDDHGWLRVAQFARENGEIPLAREIHQVYRPMGGCSMDLTPSLTAIHYAQVCEDQGDLSCTLQLRTQVMGDNFPRVAYSSYAEEAHETRVESLLSTGIDINWYLEGLLFTFSGDRYIGIDPWRIARSIRELEAEHVWRTRLLDYIEDPTLDELNRLRAAQVWMALRDDPTTTEGGIAALEDLLAVDIGPVTQVWALGQLAGYTAEE